MMTPERGWVRVVAWGVLLVTVGVVFGVPYRLSEREEVVTVQSKDMASEHHKPVYQVFTDRGVYRSGDSLVFGKFDSADVYGRLEPGHTYRVRVAGWRVPLLSWFPNIIAVTE